MSYYSAGDYYVGGDLLAAKYARYGGPRAAMASAGVFRTGLAPIGPARAATASAGLRPASFGGFMRKKLKQAQKGGMPGAKALQGFFAVKRRRMNVLNPRALRKALRRAEGFSRFARRVVKITMPKRRVHGFRFHRRKKRV